MLFGLFGDSGGIDIAGLLKLVIAFIPNKEAEIKEALKGLYNELGDSKEPPSVAQVAKHLLPLLKEGQLNEMKLQIIKKVADKQTQLGGKLVALAEMTDDDQDIILTIYLRDKETRKMTWLASYHMNSIAVPNIKLLLHGGE